MEFRKTTFNELIRKKCRERGDDPILEFRGEFCTWNELDALSDLIADDLAKRGAGAGSHIAICGMNNLYWAAAFFAAQKLGAIAILMNFSLKEQEILQNIEIGDIEYLCYGDHTQLVRDPGLLPQIQSKADSRLRAVYDITSDSGLKNRLPEAGKLRGKYHFEADSDSVACMLFTSGSTDLPKSVLLSQYGILNNACIVAEMLGQTAEDRICVTLPWFHSFGLTCTMLACMITDTQIHLVDGITPEKVLDSVSRYHCTILHAVPTLFLSMVSLPDFDRYETAQVRTSIIGSTPVIPAQLRLFQQKFPNDHFRVSYGMTETSPWVCSTAYDDTQEHLETTVGPLGPGQEIMVQDPVTKEECPRGTVGEFLLKGYNVTCGYYKLPLSKQPFDARGWLHTGDLGFLDEDGYLHLTGRVKDLIIRGGENISPMEVERAIVEDPAIHTAKVVGVPSERFGEEVAACIIMEPGQSFDEAAARSRLKARIAPFKVPSYFLLYESFPMLSNGKVDGVSLRHDAAVRTRQVQAG